MLTWAIGWHSCPAAWKQTHVYLKSCFVLVLAFSVTLVLSFHPHISFAFTACRSILIALRENAANFTLGFAQKASDAMFASLMTKIQITTTAETIAALTSFQPFIPTLYASRCGRESGSAVKWHRLPPSDRGGAQLISNSGRYYMMRRSRAGWGSSNKQRCGRQSESQRDCQLPPCGLREALSSQIRVRLRLVSSFPRRRLVSTHAVSYRSGPTQ